MKRLTHKSEQRPLSLILLACLSPLLMQCQSMPEEAPPDMDMAMPTPREVSKDEQRQLGQLISERFKEKVPAQSSIQATGPFRFVTTEEILYSDRTDVGSVVFERSHYGVSDKSLDSASIAREALLPRIETAFKDTGLRAAGVQFSHFQDEFAGAAEIKSLPREFDPRTHAKHVARTASFVRVMDGVPAFGSELLVGLMPDGRIGRFRLHWPSIDPQIVTEAKRLREAVAAQRWTVPESFRAKDIEILEVTAGVAHSGLADPGFKAKAVVRVVYRKSSKDPEYPLASTSYKYFDQTGKEVRITAFPKVAGTPVDQKRSETKAE